MPCSFLGNLVPCSCSGTLVVDVLAPLGESRAGVHSFTLCPLRSFSRSPQNREETLVRVRWVALEPLTVRRQFLSPFSASTGDSCSWKWYALPPVRYQSLCRAELLSFSALCEHKDNWFTSLGPGKDNSHQISIHPEKDGVTFSPFLGTEG